MRVFGTSAMGGGAVPPAPPGPERSDWSFLKHLIFYPAKLARLTRGRGAKTPQCRACGHIYKSINCMWRGAQFVLAAPLAAFPGICSRARPTASKRS